MPRLTKLRCAMSSRAEPAIAKERARRLPGTGLVCGARRKAVTTRRPAPGSLEFYFSFRARGAFASAAFSSVACASLSAAHMRMMTDVSRMMQPGASPR